MSVTLFEYRDDKGYVFKLKSKLVFEPIPTYIEGVNFDIDDKFYHEYKEGDEYLNEDYSEYISLKVHKINSWILLNKYNVLLKREKKLEDMINVYKKLKSNEKLLYGDILEKDNTSSICEDILLKYKKYNEKIKNV